MLSAFAKSITCPFFAEADNNNPKMLQLTSTDFNFLSFSIETVYLLTNWFVYLYGRIQSPRPDVMPDRREGITRAAGFVFACIDTQTS